MQSQISQMLMEQLKMRNPQAFQKVEKAIQNRDNPVEFFKQITQGRTPEHMEGFINFYNWAMKNGYDETLTLDRIDNNKDYCPENCRWETQKNQSNHRTNNVFYTFNGETKTSKQWCDEYNINQTTFNDRLKRGWTLEQALTISTNGTNRKVNI